MSWILTYNLLEWGIRLVMLPVILRRRFEATTALAWLMIIFFLPVLGLVLYGLIGNSGLGRRRVRLHNRVIAALRTPERLADLRARAAQPQVAEEVLPLVNQAERIGGMPVSGGNEMELLGDSEAMIDRLIADIDAAEHHVHMLFYIYEDDETGRRVAEALVRAAKRGVRCRVLADHAGSRTIFFANGLASWMNENGVQTVAALPVRPLRRRLARLDLRNHRKIVVIDGRIGYTGSQNITNADYGHHHVERWIDLTGRFQGPVVSQLQVVFMEDWMFETDEYLEGPDIFPLLPRVGEVTAQAVATGPGHESEALPRVLLAAIGMAKRKVIITTPYLVPDEPTMLALALAADRGVEVSMVVPARSDHWLVDAAGRAQFERLLESGVDIYLHRHGTLHAKTMTVDDSFAVLGSSNMDIRSFYLNFEINVLLYGPQVTRELRFAQMGYLNDSDRVTLDAWHRRPVGRRYLDAAAALLSPLL